MAEQRETRGMLSTCDECGAHPRGDWRLHKPDCTALRTLYPSKYRFTPEPQEREATEARGDELREAVNDYLLAQNSDGYDDKGEWSENARRKLCQLVYPLNLGAAALDTPTEEERDQCPECIAELACELLHRLTDCQDVSIEGPPSELEEIHSIMDELGDCAESVRDARPTEGPASEEEHGSDFPMSAERGCGASGKEGARDALGQPARDDLGGRCEVGDPPEQPPEPTGDGGGGESSDECPTCGSGFRVLCSHPFHDPPVDLPLLRTRAREADRG